MDISRNRYNGGGRRAVAVFLIFIQVLIGVGSSLPNLVPVAEAAPTANINYQGKLTDTLGVAVSDGLYDMEFSLYSVPTGGSAIWTETRTGGSQVQVTNGLFSVMLGSVNTSLASVDFSQPLYLGVNIESDGEMSPRKILGTVPSAFESFNLGGVASSSFLRSDQDDTASGLVTFTGGLISNSSSSISDLFTTNLSINSEAFTDLTGSGLSNVGGALTVSTSSLDISLEGLTDVSTMTETLGDLLYWNGSAWADIATSSLNIALSDTTGTLADGRFDKSGNWSGTFDGEEGSWYQDLANSTGDTDDIAEGSSNLFSQWDNATGGLNYAGGNVGIGTTTPYAKLSVNGNIAFTGGIYDNAASLGANGMILQTNGTAVNWVSTSSMGINITADDITDDSIENLSDVTTMTKSFGDLLYWTGASWANLATSSLAINFSDLFGVADISTQTNLGVTATGLELSGNNVALTAGYNIPLSASTTNWNGFYNTPSSRITAGEALSWSGNSLNLNIDELSTDADFGSGDYFVYQDDGGNTYKVLYDNLPGAGGGITSLNGLTDATQGFATSTDTNITLSVNSSGSSHTFTPGWTGTLSAVRGGTGLGSVTQNQILIGGAGNTWTQVATSALNINTDNLTEGLTNLFYTDNRVASYINGSSTILSGNTESILESFLSDVSNVFTNNDGSLDDDNLADNDTDDLTEGSNLYYTDARVASYINGSTSISKLGQSIDISSETNLTVGNGITLTGDQLTVTGAGGLTQAAGGLTTTGVLEDINTLGANTIADQFLVSTAAGTLAWESGATARTSLGVDAAGTDNSTNVTLAGTPNYLTLSGQQITLNKLDITDDTNATGGVGIDITANDFTLDLNELTTETSIATGDFISMVDITDNGSGKITYANFVSGDWTGTLDGIEGSAFALDSDIGTTIQGYNANTSILGSTINANELASEDFGDFTCNGTTCSLDAAYLTGNQTITLTGDVTGTGATSITTSIAADSIVEADLNADNGAVDGDFLQYDNTGGNFVWRDAGEVRSDLSLVVGTNVQAYDADLTTWAGISPSANAQSLVSAANYAAMRTLLDLEAGTDFYSIAAADAAFEGELNNEAGLYAALSDVTQFWEAGDTITSGVWQGTAILDTYISDSLTLGAGSSITANDIVSPDNVLSTGQAGADEYCLTYEATGDTWEWQDCSATSVTLAGLTDTDVAGATGGDLLSFDGSNWVDVSTSTFLMETELDSEAELESQLVGVTNVFTNNDGALDDDDLSDNTTTDLTEGTNQYFTNTRARDAISETITGITYTSGTGVFSQTAGYEIPLTASTSNWTTAFNWGDHSLVGYITDDTSVPKNNLVNSGTLPFTWDISSETNLTVGNGITLTGDQLTVTGAGGLTQAAGGLTTTGVLEDLNTLGANTIADQFLVSTAAGTLAWESGATARTSLGVDAAGTDNSTNVTLAGTPNYLTLSGQQITLNKLDITDDTNATGGVGIDITANDFTLDLNELTTETSIATGDFISMVDITDNGSGKITYANFVSGDWTGTLDGIEGSAFALDSDIGTTIQGYNANTSILGSTINANELASEDFGDFTCNGTTCSLDAAYLTGNQTITLTGDVTGTGATSITTSIAADSIVEADLNADNGAVDGDFLQYDNTGGNFVWRDAGEVRSDLSLVVGTNVQAYDADLTTWAGISPSANAQSLVSAANYAAMRTLLDLEAGTDFYSIAAADAAFEGELNNEAGLYAALSDVTQFWEAGDTITSGVWQGTAILDTYISDSLTLGAGSSITANDIVSPDNVLSTGQAGADEYCLTYEATGDTWEWQDCSATSVTLAGLTDTDVAGATGGDLLSFDGSNWVDVSTSTFLMETELDSEAELESQLVGVTNVFTNNDGALDDDDLSDNTTTDLTEGTNQYFTNTRARDAISETITGITYTSGTGVFSQTAGYEIPLTASTSNWTTAFNWGDHSLVGYITDDTSVPKNNLVNSGTLPFTWDISSETNLTVGNGITLTGDQLTVTGAGGLTQAAGGLTTTGVLEDLNTLGANTIADQFLVSTAAGTLAWESGATARTSLGVDAAGTDNSTNVTLAGTPNYLTLSGQQITLNKLDITDDTNATGGVGIDITANDFTLDLNELTTETSIATGDFISMVDITDNGSGKITYANFVSGDWTGTLDGIEGSAFALDSDIGTTIQGYNANTSILGSTINANELASEDFGDFTCNGTTCSLDAAYLTGNQTITLTGDVTGTGATSITTSIAADSIVEADLNADNGAVDGDFLQYDNTGGNFVWRDAGEVRSDLSLVVGTNVQAYDADLTTWAGISPSANAQSLVSAANYAAMRTLLDLEAGTDFYSIAAADAAFEGELNNEAGLYAALSDVTQFWEAGDTITSGVWQGTAILDTYISDSLTLGAGSSITANDIVSPDNVLSTGQAGADEYCLTYEATGDTWEWQDCSATSVTLAGLTDTDVAGATGGDLLSFDGSNWVDVSTSTFLMETELDSEAELESQLVGVTNVFTNNDGALDDDDLSDNTTTDLTEGTNQYFTNTRARDAISETITGITYTSGTGVFSQTAGYEIPLTASTSNWTTAFNWGDHSLVGYITDDTSVPKNNLVNSGTLPFTWDISSETNLTVGNGITLTGDQLTVTGAGGLTQAAGGLTTTGVLEDLNTLGANTIADQFLVSTAAGTLAWESGATARTSLGVDAAGTDNSTNVTLAGTPNYLTLSGQQITLNKLDITDDTNATGGVGIDITANDFTLDLNELTTETSIATGDFISMVDITDNGSGKITYANFVSGDWTGTLDGIEGSAFALDSDIGTTIQGYNANTSILGSTINANELASEDFGDFTCNGTTCSLDAAYLTGNQTITLTGDVTGTGATSITTSIAADSIVEADLNADNGAVDGDFLQYDNTGGNFVWRDAGEVRSDLSLVVGTNVQAYDADLTTWAGISPSANAQSLVSAANYAAMRTLLDLEAGTDFYSIAAADAAFEGELNNEAGLYAALSDVTQFWEAGDTITSGVWQGTAIGDAYLTKTGDWTGTFDGQEGTYYLDNATHTGDVTGSGALAIANDVVAFGDIDYSLTLASNPGLLVDECYFAKTTSGGGFICEGSTADNNEQLYLLPDLNGADTTDTIATLGSTQTFTGVKTISSNWVNTANPWADNEVSDVLTVAGGTIGSNNISSASTWTTLGTLTIGDGGDRIDISSNTWDVTNGVITNATWNGAAIGDSYITKSGNWTGTFDGQEGSYYLANSFSTSSADYWETQQTSRSADDLSDDSIEALSDVASMSEITGDLLSWTGSAWSNVATSTLGLGNGTFLGLTDTPGSYTASAIPFVSGSALSFDSTFVYDGTNLGIGSSTPSSKLTIAGTEGSTDDIFNVASSSGYSYFSISSNGDLDVNNGAISYDSTNNQTSIANLLLGNVNFADDAGVVSWVDMNVTASSAVNTVLSYTASLDGNSLLTLYGKSDGSGGVTNLAVGIGTTTPSAKLTIAGTEGSTDDIFNVASSSGLSYLSISSDGNIDINNGAFYYDLALNKTSIERLDLGNVEFEQDAGWVSWIDLDVSASSTVGDVMAYSAQIDANELLTVYGEADGSGGIQNTRVFVGTTSSAVLGSSNIPDNSLIIGGGALCVDDNGGSNCDDAARTAGTIYAESSSVTAIDLAENYPTLDTSLEAGELVALAPKFQEVCTEVDENGEVRCTETDLSSVPLVEKADVTNSPTVLGIISTEPGVLLGGFGSSELAEFEKVPVALSGRVPVKVTDEAGVISPGDYVMLSDTMPGYAMKANKPGMAVGVALESFSPVDIKNEVSEGTDDSMETTVGVLEDNGFDVEKAVVGTKKKASSTSSSTNPVFVNTSQLILDDDKDTEVATGTIVVFVERTPLYITDFDFFSASSTIEVDEDSFWGRLAALAASFKDGVMSLMGLVIGSQEAPAGITIYDVVTGQPFCMYVANGQQVSREGSCDTLDLSDTTPVATSTPQDSGSGGNSSGGGNTGGGETIPDSISLSLNGQNPVSINIGDVYVDAGVTVNNASDESYGYLETVDGLAVGAINLDTSTTTQYEIGYEVLDTDGSHAVITRTVIVQEIPDNDGGDDTSTSTEEVNAPDTTAPVISLNGSASIELTVGDSYNENGATAVDETDGDLTGQINTSGAVNTNTAGSYTVTYEVSDMAGNSAQASRTVTVSPAPTAPAPLPTTSTATST